MHTFPRIACGVLGGGGGCVSLTAQHTSSRRAHFISDPASLSHSPSLPDHTKPKETLTCLLTMMLGLVPGASSWGWGGGSVLRDQAAQRVPGCATAFGFVPRG